MVTFSCKKSGSQFHLGYSSLFRLRCVIAKLADADFGRLYASIVDAYSLPLSERTKFLEERYYEINLLLLNNRVDHRVADFCLSSDCDGDIDADACDAVWKVIDKDGGIDDDKFKELKALIKECCEKRSDLTWY